MAICSRVVNRSCCFVHEHEVHPFYVCSSWSSIFVWKILMKAPEHTPYEGGMFISAMQQGHANGGASVDVKIDGQIQIRNGKYMCMYIHTNSYQQKLVGKDKVTEEFQRSVHNLQLQLTGQVYFSGIKYTMNCLSACIFSAKCHSMKGLSLSYSHE